MTWVTLKGRWTRLKGVIEERLGYITHDDLEIMMGQTSPVDRIVAGELWNYEGRGVEAVFGSTCNNCIRRSYRLWSQQARRERGGTDADRETRPSKVKVSSPEAFSQVVDFVQTRELILQK
jgi:hypothetical protein